MLKQTLTFFAIQVSAFLLSFFILIFVLAADHGRLSFHNIGGTMALVVTIIQSIPILFLIAQRHKLKTPKTLFAIAILLFCFSLTTIFIGLPTITKEFIIDKEHINNISVYPDKDLGINFKLAPEMFNRVSIEADINKSSGVEITKLNLTTYNSKGQILRPEFQPIAWDSLHSRTLQMDSFFEINDYTKMNRFALQGQYSILGTGSLIMQVDYAFSKNSQTISNNNKFFVRIANRLILERLIDY